MKEYDIAENVKASPVTPFGDVIDKAPLALDNKYITNYVSTAESCWVGMDFGENIGVLIDEIRFYPKNNIKINSFKDALILGTNDITNIATVLSDKDAQSFTGMTKLHTL